MVKKSNGIEIFEEGLEDPYYIDQTLIELNRLKDRLKVLEYKVRILEGD